MSLAKKARNRRMVMIALAVCSITVAVAGLLYSFQNQLVYFYAPSDPALAHVTPAQYIRVGGLVKEGSVKREGNIVQFVIEDEAGELALTYEGILPNLFREKQGVVAEGNLIAQGQFKAAALLAKHDENYMPPEVARALKESGQWKADMQPEWQRGQEQDTK